MFTRSFALAKTLVSNRTARVVYVSWRPFTTAQAAPVSSQKLSQAFQNAQAPRASTQPHYTSNPNRGVNYQKRVKQPDKIEFKAGDLVRYQVGANTTEGMVKALHTKSVVDEAGRTHNGTPENPIVEIQNHYTKHIVFHHPSVLNWLARGGDIPPAYQQGGQGNHPPSTQTSTAASAASAARPTTTTAGATTGVRPTTAPGAHTTTTAATSGATGARPTSTATPGAHTTNAAASTSTSRSTSNTATSTHSNVSPSESTHTTASSAKERLQSHSPIRETPESTLTEKLSHENSPLNIDFAPGDIVRFHQGPNVTAGVIDDIYFTIQHDEDGNFHGATRENPMARIQNLWTKKISYHHLNILELVKTREEASPGRYAEANFQQLHVGAGRY